MNKKIGQSIVVAIGNPYRRKQPALNKAAKMAQHTGARLTLLHTFAFPYPLPDPAPLNGKEAVRATQTAHYQRLMRLARPLRAKGLHVDCVVQWDFPPHEAIVRYVIQHEPDLLIAESHRHGRMARWLLANTDWELIRECPCPLWFVKSATFLPQPVVMAAVDPLHAHAKPSQLDDRILECARQVERQFGGNMYLSHVYEIPMTVAPGALVEPVFVPMPPPDARRFKELVDRKVTQLARRHRIDKDRCLIQRGDPSHVLSTLVEQLKVNLLVMGAVSRRGLARAFIGNTAERVIDQVNCDVMVVKPAQFRPAVPRRRSMKL